MAQGVLADGLEFLKGSLMAPRKIPNKACLIVVKACLTADNLIYVHVIFRTTPKVCRPRLKRSFFLLEISFRGRDVEFLQYTLIKLAASERKRGGSEPLRWRTSVSSPYPTRS